MSFVTISVVKFCNNLNFVIISVFLVWFKFESMNFDTIEVFSFVTIRVFEFCHYLSFCVVLPFEFWGFDTI